MDQALVMAALGMLTIGAAPPAAPLDQPSYAAPATAWRDIADAEARCRDRIDHARSSEGKPPLERGPADPEKPLLMYAVDTRVDGCGVLVPVGDPTDLRQSPKPGAPEIIPAR